MPFITQLVVRELEDNKWELVEPLVYEGNKDRFVVERGFITDFASVPKAFWNLVPPYGRYTKAAVVHDFFYRIKPISREDADGIFRRIMTELGVSWITRNIMYASVRLGGFFSW
jgi:hypothetical protein